MASQFYYNNLRSIEMSIVKNGLALIGLFVVAKTAYTSYGRYVRKPLEEKIANVMADEGEIAQRIRDTAVQKEREAATRKVRDCAYRAAAEIGLVGENTSKLADRVGELFAEEINK